MSDAAWDSSSQDTVIQHGPAIMSDERTLCRFRAGRMLLQGAQLVPDPRKGYVQIVEGYSGRLQLQWVERTAEGEYAGYPQFEKFIDAKAEASKIKARVFKINFAGVQPAEKFFWMQEPDEGLDDVNIHQLNLIFDAFGASELPSTAESTERTAPGATPQPAQPGLPRPAAEGVQATDLARVLSAIGMPQPTSAEPPGAVPGTAPGALTAEALAAALSGLSGGGGTGGGIALPQPGPSLAEVLRPEVVRPLVADRDTAERLFEFLPPEHRNGAGVAAAATSAQFRHQLDVFSAALQSGQLDLRQFGLNAAGFSVVEFLEAFKELGKDP